MAVWKSWWEGRYLWQFNIQKSMISICHAWVLQVGWVAIVAFMRLVHGHSHDLAFHSTVLRGHNLVSFTKGLSQWSRSYHWNAMAGEPLDLVVTILTEFLLAARLTASLTICQSKKKYPFNTCPSLTVVVTFRHQKYFNIRACWSTKDCDSLILSYPDFDHAGVVVRSLAKIFHLSIFLIS